MKTMCVLLLSALCLLNLEGSASTLDLLKQRHSGYSFDATKDVSEEQIQALIEASKTTPSCFNDQPWYFVFADRKKNPESYNKILNSLVEKNQQWAKNAPVLVAIIADSKFRHNNGANRWGSYDTGAAAFALMLQATDMGLMTHQMGGFDEKKIQKDLNIPARYSPISVMAIGYEVSGEELKEKTRRPSQENFFKGSWENK